MAIDRISLPRGIVFDELHPAESITEIIDAYKHFAVSLKPGQHNITPSLMVPSFRYDITVYPDRTAIVTTLPISRAVGMQREARRTTPSGLGGGTIRIPQDHESFVIIGHSTSNPANRSVFEILLNRAQRAPTSSHRR